MGIPKGNIFVDKQSGKNTARPGLQKILKTVRSGDTIIVESVSRFARNTRDLLELIEKLTEMGVEFVSYKEHIEEQCVFRFDDILKEIPRQIQILC